MTQIKKTRAQPVSPPAWTQLARVASADASDSAASFSSLLHRTIGLSLAAQVEQEDGGKGRTEAAAASPVAVIEPLPAQDALTLVLKGLAPDAALKLRTLMLAGRDARELTFIQGALTQAEQDPVFAALDLGRNAPQLSEYLRRGHAIACATRFDLEIPIAQWTLADRPPLGERVWLRFGKELATSAPDTWECLGVLGSTRAKLLTKLYLRVGKETWWSFGSVIDRPSPAVVKAQQKARAGRGATKLGGGLLRDVIKYECEPDKRALRRAIRAIQARLGGMSDAQA
jgi:hypothetical protein